jgi:hypothetical protein
VPQNGTSITVVKVAAKKFEVPQIALARIIEKVKGPLIDRNGPELAQALTLPLATDVTR